MQGGELGHTTRRLLLCIAITTLSCLAVCTSRPEVRIYNTPFAADEDRPAATSPPTTVLFSSTEPCFQAGRYRQHPTEIACLSPFLPSRLAASPDAPAMEGSAVQDDLLDSALDPPVRLFERLSQIAGYSWDETKPPTHSSYDNW